MGRANGEALHGERRDDRGRKGPASDQTAQGFALRRIEALERITLLNVF